MYPREVLPAHCQKATKMSPILVGAVYRRGYATYCVWARHKLQRSLEKPLQRHDAQKYIAPSQKC